MHAKGLGTIVTWDVRGFVQRDAFVDAMKDHGFEDIPIPKSRMRTFVRRAIKDCVSCDLIRLIGENEKKITFATVNENKNLDHAHWRGDVSDVITFDKQTNAVQGDENDPFVSMIQNTIKHREDMLTAQDVADSVKRVLQRQCNSVPLRDAGGAYFVPIDRNNVLDRLDAALSECQKRVLGTLGGGIGSFKINRLPVAANARAAEDLANIVVTAFHRQVQELREAAFEIARDAKSRPATVKAKAAKIAKLLVKAKEYQTLLEREELITLQESIKRSHADVVKAYSMKRDGKKQQVAEAYGAYNAVDATKAL